MIIQYFFSYFPGDSSWEKEFEVLKNTSGPSGSSSGGFGNSSSSGFGNSSSSSGFGSKKDNEWNNNFDDDYKR